MLLSRLFTPSNLLLPVVLLAAACSDSSGPRAPITVALEAFVTQGPTITAEEGSTLVACSMLVEAVASGSGTASWESGAVYFYSGKDRSEAEDTVALTAETVAGYWDAAEIEVGQTQEMRLSFRAPFPFGVKLEMRYRAKSGGPTRTADTEIVCGPVAGENSVPPTVTALSVQPATGEVEPGQTITVQFAAAGPIGLLRTEVKLSGACDHVVNTAELLAPTVTRTVAIPLPVPCATDRPLVITVTAIDGALETASRAHSMTLTMIDLTAPTLAVHHHVPESRYGTGVTADYFTLGSVLVGYEAYDAHGVAALVWEVLPAGARDSIVFAPGTTRPMGLVNIPILPEWGTGKVQLRLHARDVNGRLSTVWSSAPDFMVVYPTLEPPSLTINVSGDIQDVIVDTRRGVLYVRQYNQHRIAVMSLTDLSTTRLIDVPPGPWDFDMTASGDSLVVTIPESKALAVIDLRQPAPVAVVVPLVGMEPGVVQKPRFIRTTTSKALLTIESAAPHPSRVAEVDLSTGVLRFRLDAGDAGEIGAGPLEHSHDRSVIAILGGPQRFQRYDASTDTFGARGTADPVVELFSIDSTGRRFATGTTIYDANMQMLRRVGPASSAAPSLLSPNGEYLYIHEAFETILRVRVSDGAIVDRVLNKWRAGGLLRMSADGSVIVTADRGYGETSKLTVFRMR